MKKPLVERFMSHVEKTPSGCWLWKGHRRPEGYGVIKVDGKALPAHRVSWSIHKKEDPGLLCVLHKCDNPPCVNPEHLFLGTRLVNNQDMDQKGRRKSASGALHGSKTMPERVARGERNGRARLSVPDVEEIRRRAANGETVASLAREKQVSEGAVRGIVKGRRWQHIGGANV